CVSGPAPTFRWRNEASHHTERVMSRDKLIIFGVVLLGLLGFLVSTHAKRDESLGAPMASAKDFPTISAPDDVDKISITNGDKGEVLLDRVPDPKAATADG